MLLSFVAGALGAPLGELGIDINGDGVPDEIISLDEIEAESSLNPELVEVEGYHRADGTWVEPHFRTAPDAVVTNNLSWWELVNA